MKKASIRTESIWERESLSSERLERESTSAVTAVTFPLSAAMQSVGAAIDYCYTGLRRRLFESSQLVVPPPAEPWIFIVFVAAHRIVLSFIGALAVRLNNQ